MHKTPLIRLPSKKLTQVLP